MNPLSYETSRRSILRLAYAATLPGVLRAVQQDVVMRANADLVVLDVSVFGSTGVPVSGLVKEQFVIREDGKRQNIKQFSAAESPVSIGFLIDMSGSMRSKLDGVRRAADAFLRASNPKDEYFLIEFNDKAWIGLPAGLPFSSGNEVIRKALLSVRAEGRTALYDGLMLGLRHVQNSKYERRVLVLITDGKDTASSTSISEAIQYVRSSPITVYTIGLFGDDDDDSNPALLKHLAKLTGGRFFHPATPEEIARDCGAIARDIRARYTLAYTPPETAQSAI